MSANDFSFKAHAVGPQSIQQTHLIMAYELGRLIEYNHKANIYGASGYYCNANQQKEMSDLISMLRYYGELCSWPTLDKFSTPLRGHYSPEDCLESMLWCIGQLDDVVNVDLIGELLMYTHHYCHLKHWNYSVLEMVGQEAYLERMRDIAAHGVKR